MKTTNATALNTVIILVCAAFGLWVSGLSGTAAGGEEGFRLALKADAPTAPAAAASEDGADLGAGETLAPADAMIDPSADDSDLAAGDRVRIQFYERKDISGVFRVRQDGKIVLPLFGAFDAQGKPVSELEASLADAFQAMTGRTIFVTAEIAQRLPVYTVGFVSKPGSYAYSSGMTVLHAVSLSGGLYRPFAEGGGGVTETTKEMNLLQQSRDNLQRAIALKARLEAERDGKDKVAVPDRLVEMAGKAAAEDLILAETRLMQQRAAVLKQQIDGNLAASKLGAEEIASLKAQLGHIEEQVRLSKGDLSDALKLSDKGLMRAGRISELQRFIAQLQGDTREVTASIARAGVTQANLDRDRSLLVLEHKSKLEAEIQAANEKIAQNEAAIKASQQLIQKLTGLVTNSKGALTPQPVNYEILRRAPGGQIRIEATELTALQPGDMLRVSPAHDAASLLSSTSLGRPDISLSSNR